MSKYAELIARLKKATGPDRELDVAICEATGNYSRRSYSEWCGIQPKGSRPTITDFLNARLSTRYTASIDAALTLVPEGDHYETAEWKWRVTEFQEWNNDNKNWWWQVRLSGWPNNQPKVVEGNHKQPAIALCIAALKAREAQ